MSDVKKDVAVEEVVASEENDEQILESKSGFLTWVNEHRNQLIIAGISITALIGLILGIKNMDVLKELKTVLNKKININSIPTLPESESQPAISVLNLVDEKSTYTPPKEAFDVRMHVRTMAAGRHHSVAKAEEAARLGIKLLPNQTIVDTYPKYTA